MSKEANRNRIGEWWKQNYTYVVSSLIIIALVSFVLYIKHFWPFGKSVIMYGDYVTQSWNFLAEFKNKIAAGDSLFYTWHAGFGTNYYSILSFGVLNPFLFIFMMVPSNCILQVGTVVYVIVLVCMNCSMLYFLTNRPKNKMARNKIANMLFSMAYALCIYVVSNINIWYFLACAIFFPLILLGLERYVAGQGWKLYAITLALAFLSNYYFTALFCVFIVLYYLTLEFGSFRNFWKKSLGILAVSIISGMTAGVILIPTAFQMMRQDYTTSPYDGSMVFFTSFFDIIKNWFIFNNYIETGTTLESYGEVSLYYGLLPLMLTTFYFFSKSFKWTTKVRKLLVLVVYFMAFNTNALNYVMHLFHYPTGYPNRFSLFFILYCVILAYEAWSAMDESDYSDVTILKGCIIGIGWTVLTLCTFAFAETIQYQFTYYYSIMAFMIYMIAIIILPLLKGKAARVLAVVGCIELCLNFWYVSIFRNASITVDEVVQREKETEDFFASAELPEQYGFSRMLGANDIVGNLNSGMLFDYNGTTVFCSSIGDVGAFLDSVGIYSAKNNIQSFEFTKPTFSMLNVQYVFFDNKTYRARNCGVITSIRNPYEHYPTALEDGEFKVYENEDVLSIGYRIDSDAVDLFDEDFMVYASEGMDKCALINKWIEGVSGVSNVFEQQTIPVEAVQGVNCLVAVMGENVLIARDQAVCEAQGFNLNQENVCASIPDEKWVKNVNSYAEMQYTVPEDGEYYYQYGRVLMSTGYLHKGDTFAILRDIEENVLESDTPYEACTITIYKFNEEQWEQAYQVLSEQQLQVKDYTSARMNAEIDVQEDGVLFTSIPYDTNWHVYVDGTEVDVIPLWQESFVGVELSRGHHEVELRYHQQGFWLGVLSTGLGCICIAGGIVLEQRKKSRNKLEEEITREENDRDEDVRE